MMRNATERAMMIGTVSADTKVYHGKGYAVSAVFAIMLGFMFGFIVAEIAHHYFEVDLPSFF